MATWSILYKGPSIRAAGFNFPHYSERKYELDAETVKEAIKQAPPDTGTFKDWPAINAHRHYQWKVVIKNPEDKRKRETFVFTTTEQFAQHRAKDVVGMWLARRKIYRIRFEDIVVKFEKVKAI